MAVLAIKDIFEINMPDSKDKEANVKITKAYFFI
jgi:hypothetical protein